MKLEITSTEDGLLAVLDGRLDTAASQQFAIDMQPLMDQADKHITLDCTKLDFISSSGLRLMLTLRKATIAANGDILLKGLNDNVRQVFAMTGFVSLFKIE